MFANMWECKISRICSTTDFLVTCAVMATLVSVSQAHALPLSHGNPLGLGLGDRIWQRYQSYQYLLSFSSTIQQHLWRSSDDGCCNLLRIAPIHALDICESCASEFSLSPQSCLRVSPSQIYWQLEARLWVGVKPVIAVPSCAVDYQVCSLVVGLFPLVESEDAED